MQKVKLQDIAEFIRTGKTPPTNQTQYFDGQVNWYTPGDFNNGKILSTSKRTLTQIALDDKKAITFPKNTLLITCIGDIGKIGITQEDCSSNQQITGIKPKENTDVNYLYYWFIANKKVLENTANSAIVPILNNKTLQNIDFQSPNLPTQQKIAAILDKADELRQYNKQLIEKYDALTQSLFLDMFGDPVKNEKGWEICTFSQILSKIESGWSPVCENKPRVNDKEWAVLKLGSVSYGTYNPKENKKYEFDVPKTKQDCEVKKGDLLFTRKNTYHMVGTTVFVYETSPRLLLPDTVFRLLYRKEKTSPIFLYYLLNHKKFIKEIQSLASGTSGSMPNISKAKLLSKETILPPISLQNEFAERVQLIEIQKQQAQEALVKSEDLFQSLLQRAFKGELT